jgi:hypothetical protein
MHVEWVPNRGRRPTILLRETWREGKQVKKRTLANLTDWPEKKIEALRKVLRGESLVSPETALTIERSLPHGHVEAILGTIKKLGLDGIIASKPCRERDLVLAMITERLLHPSSKLATTRLWHTTTVAEELSATDADETALYDALDWLAARQGRIEKKLAARHLDEGSLVLYDVTSSYYEGHTCPLARFGHDRDGEKGKPIIVYGTLTDKEGRPVALSVYPGNTGDPTTALTISCSWEIGACSRRRRSTPSKDLPAWDGSRRFAHPPYGILWNRETYRCPFSTLPTLPRLPLLSILGNGSLRVTILSLPTNGSGRETNFSKQRRRY